MNIYLGFFVLVGGAITIPLLFVVMGWISLQLIHQRFTPAKRDEATRRLRTVGFPTWRRAWANVSVACGVGVLVTVVVSILTYDYRQPLTLSYIRYLWDF